MVSATNFISFYMAFELLSISTYALMLFKKTNQTIEAAIRYFFFGFLASILLVWGFSILYLYTNTTILINLKQFYILNNNWELIIAVYFIFLAFLIKLGLFPYHT
jgi:NADH-quinone oxidoreductase subunit N